MPRLPTIRVIGSQAISTSWVFSVSVARDWVPVIGRCCPGPLEAGLELTALDPPAGLGVDRLERDAPQLADDLPVRATGGARHLAAGWGVHERHELVGEAGHRAADADPADVRAAAHAVDPPALRHVALHDRAPAPQLHQARRLAVLGGEVALLVVAAAVAALVHRRAEEPRGPARVVQRDHRRGAGGLVE